MPHLVNPNLVPLNKNQERHRDIIFSKLVIDIFLKNYIAHDKCLNL